MKKQKKLYKIFIRNYIIVFILLFFSLFIIQVIISSVDRSDQFKSTFSANAFMEDNYKNIDCTKLLKIGGSMCVINDNYIILRSMGKPIFYKHTISRSEFTDYLTSIDKTINYVTAKYNEKYHFWLIVSAPRQVRAEINIIINSKKGNSDSVVYLLLIGLCIVIFLISILVFSLITAATFRKPLIKLKKIAENIKSGRFETPKPQSRISEIYYVEEAFYLMSEKIAEEIRNTKKSEQTTKNLMLDISHDLKNPLMSIMGYANLLENQKNEENRNKYLKIIFENSKRADRLAQDLFLLAKMENTKYVLNREKVDLAELLKTTLINRKDEIDTKGLLTEFDIPDEEVFVEGASLELIRVFSNIIDNALKYCMDSSMLHIKLSINGNYTEISFTNSSKLSCDDKVHLSDAFVRSDGSDILSPEGTGLGLNIVESIIRKHGGNMKCGYHGGNYEIKLFIPLLHNDD